MAFNIQGTATFNTNIGVNDGFNFSLNTNYSNVSPNAIANYPNITGSVFTLLDAGSVTNCRYIIINNEDFSSSVQVATGSLGQNTIGVCQPQDSLVIPWSGSITLYAKSIPSATGTNNTGAVVINYGLIPF